MFICLETWVFLVVLTLWFKLNCFPVKSTCWSCWHLIKNGGDPRGSLVGLHVKSSGVFFFLRFLHQKTKQMHTQDFFCTIVEESVWDICTQRWTAIRYILTTRNAQEAWWPLTNSGCTTILAAQSTKDIMFNRTALTVTAAKTSISFFHTFNMWKVLFTCDKTRNWNNSGPVSVLLTQTWSWWTVLPCPSFLLLPLRSSPSWLCGRFLAWASGTVRATSSHRLATTSHHLIPAEQHRFRSRSPQELFTFRRAFYRSAVTVEAPMKQDEIFVLCSSPSPSTPSVI